MMGVILYEPLTIMITIIGTTNVQMAPETSASIQQLYHKNNTKDDQSITYTRDIILLLIV